MSPEEHRELLQRIRRITQPLEPLPTGYPERLGPLPGIRAVLFDIYGTLLCSAAGDVGPDSAEDDQQAFVQALEAVGLPVLPGVGVDQLRQGILDAQQARRTKGVEFPEVDIKAVWSSLLQKAGIVAEPGVVRALALEYECRVNPVWPMPGLAELLRTLRDRGLALGVVSNAQFYTPLLLEGLLGKDLPEWGLDPELCVWSWRWQEGKPAPRLFHIALEGLARRGIQAGETLYLGNDLLKDIWPASTLGCRTALFAGDRRSLRLRQDDPRVAGVQADRVVTGLGSLAGML